MCGRTACTLAPGEICKACSYKPPGDEKFKQADWMDSISSFDYKPSYNVAPTWTTPILTLKKHFDKDCSDQDRVVVPMVWGYIPRWHKGEFNKHGYSTNNCRTDHVMTSKLYSHALKEGMRCVVLCDGFYEWKHDGAHKQPYLIYMRQPEGVKVEDRSTWNMTWSEDEGYHGPRLVPMAGLFGEWISPEGEKVLNYTIMTMDAPPSMTWIHERMPVILDTEEKMNKWLDTGVVAEEAMKVVEPTDVLTQHPVTSDVGNVKNNTIDCMQPIDLKAVKKEPASALMANWLKKASPVKAGSKSPSSKEERARSHSPKRSRSRSPIKSEEAVRSGSKSPKVKDERSRSHSPERRSKSKSPGRAGSKSLSVKKETSPDSGKGKKRSLSPQPSPSRKAKAAK